MNFAMPASCFLQTIVISAARNSLLKSAPKTACIASTQFRANTLSDSRRYFHNAHPLRIDDNSAAPIEYDKLSQDFNIELVKASPEKVQKILNEVLSLNVLEMNQLMRRLQIRLGLPEDFYDEKIRANSHSFASAPVETAAPVEVAPEPVKEKEAFDIKLTEVDPKSKIKIIKEIRTITGLGLKEAKELVESAPCVVKQGLKKDEAEKMQKVIEEAGGKAEMI